MNLPTASAANQVPFSLGSGGIYEARPIVINTTTDYTVPLDSPSTWTLNPTPPGSVVVAGGKLTSTVAVGTTNSYQEATHTLPDTMMQWRIRWRMGISAPTLSPNTVIRPVIYRDPSLTVSETFGLDLYGGLSRFIGYWSSVCSGLPTDGSLCMSLEGFAQAVRLFTGVSIGGEPPLVWTLRLDYNNLGVSGFGAPTAIRFSTVCEGAAQPVGDAVSEVSDIVYSSAIF